MRCLLICRYLFVFLLSLITNKRIVQKPEKESTKNRCESYFYPGDNDDNDKMRQKKRKQQREGKMV